MNITNITGSELCNDNKTCRDTCPLHEDCSYEIRVAGFITLAEGILTLFLNGIVIVLLAKQRKKTNIVFLLLHLAVTDIAVAVLHDLFRTLQLLTDWTYGEVFCVAFLYSQQVALFASTFILLSLCYDRLFAIWRPLWPGRSGRRNRWGMILFPWLFAATFSIPYFKSGVILDCGKVWCSPLFRGKYGDIFLPMQMTLMSFLPSVIMVAVYSYIANIIRTGTREAYGVIADAEASRTCIPNNQFQSRMRAERRSILVAVVVGLAFIICWVPYHFSIIFSRYAKIPTCHFYIFNALAPLNSLINPVLVMLLNYRMFVRNDRERDLSLKIMTRGTLLSMRKSTSRSSESR